LSGKWSLHESKSKTIHKILLKKASPPKGLFERPQSPRLAEFLKSTRF